MSGLLADLQKMLLRNQVLAAVAWVLVITALVEWVVLDLSQMGALVLFLFLVITSAYYFPLWLSLLVSLLAYLLLNFLVVEPRYSLHVPDPRSWIVLLGFLWTSLRVNSLAHTLKKKTLEAETSAAHHRFARSVSEALLEQDNVEAALRAVIRVLQSNAEVRCDWIPQLPPQANNTAWTRAGTEVFESVDTSGRSTWFAPVIGPNVQSGYLRVTAPHGHVDYLVKENLQLACNQLNACIHRIESVSQLQEAQLQAREEEVRSHLLASLSHDMRTPLTAILGAATALGAQYDQLSDEQVQQLISSIEAESFHMVTSSENVLSMVKLKSIASLPDPLPWQSPIEIIEATVRRYELRRNQKRFAVESPPDPPLLQADAMLLSQALANLIDNAISVHLSEEPIVIQVESESQHDFMIIRMSVLDRGPGFPEGFTPQDIRAFEIPKRAAPNQSVHKGFGLGLTIVQAIVSLHRGQLSIQAREGGGAVVSMVFQSQSPSVEHHVL